MGLRHTAGVRVALLRHERGQTDASHGEQVHTRLLHVKHLASGTRDAQPTNGRFFSGQPTQEPKRNSAI